MDINDLRSIATVGSFVVFVSILIWTWNKRNSRDFKEAANLPFAEDTKPVRHKKIIAKKGKRK
jgi:cytochrome c oxidase cbb3-type subunit 4